MIVIGWDTGSGHVGRCKLEVTRASAVYVFADEINVGHKVPLKRPRVRKNGAVQTEELVMTEADIASFYGVASSYLRLSVEDGSLCVVERRERVHAIKGKPVSTTQATQLKTADWLGGEIASAARGMGYGVHLIPPEEWRKALTGNIHASNAEISEAVSLSIDGWPKRSNPHMRDAAGMALYCARREMAKRGGQTAETPRVTRGLSSLEKLRAYQEKHPKTCGSYDGLGCTRELGCIPD